MSWSGGTYSKGNAGTGGWVGDASLGIGIEAGRHDTQDNDFATGINQCLNKDGSNSCTGDLNLGGFKPVNLAAGTAAAPAICAGGDINTGIFSPAADQIGIATNGTERVRISDTGRVGIGTSAPYSSLDVLDSFQLGASATATNNFHITAISSGVFAGNLIIWNGNTGAGTERMRIDNGGRTAINGSTTSPGNTQFYAVSSTASRAAGRFYTSATGDDGTPTLFLDKQSTVNTTAQVFIQCTINAQGTAQGQINANGASQLAFGTFSDQRLKENIEDLPNQLDNIVSLRPVEFDYKNGSGHQIGFIAQEVQTIYPDLVNADSQGMLNLSGLGKWEARLVKAIQELNAKVEALEAKIIELEAT